MQNTGLKQIIFLALAPRPSGFEALEEELWTHGVKLWYGLPQPVENYRLEESLFIADREDVCRGLMEKGCSLIAWLHEGNREQRLDFVPYALECPKEAEYTYFYRVFCRYHGLPWMIGETERCRIRETTLEDMDALYEIYSDPSVTRFAEAPYENREEERRYLQEYIRNAYGFWGFGTWMIERKTDGRIIGRAGFNLREGCTVPELGFVIGAPHQRQGYAYECCSRILEVGRLEYGFTEVQALLEEENEASLALCRKLGFLPEGPVYVENERYLRMLWKDG